MVEPKVEKFYIKMVSASLIKELVYTLLTILQETEREPKETESESKEKQAYIYREEKQLGPYSETLVKTWMKEGEIQGTDLAWYEGLKDWKPVSDLFTN